MKCPVDQTELEVTERQGIEIDICPTCKGVWLGRGELDKLIERAIPPVTAPEPQDMRDDRKPESDERAREWNRADEDRHSASRRKPRPRGHRHRHRKSLTRNFLEELFDID